MITTQFGVDMTEEARVVSDEEKVVVDVEVKKVQEVVIFTVPSALVTLGQRPR